MQLGLIVLPADEAELNAALEALSALGVSAVAATVPSKPAATTGKGKTAAAKAAEPAPTKEKLKTPTGEELVALMTRVRDELGAETVTELLTSYGASKLKELDKSDWPAIFAAAQVALDGVGGDDDGLDDDDGLGLDDDDGLGLDDEGGEGEEVDHEEVKVACQAYAKVHGRAKTEAILQKHGLNTVRGLAKADNGVLAAIMKAVS